VSRNGGVLLTSVTEGIATLTLNRPDKRNALDGALVEALAEAVRRTAVDDTVRVIAIRGAGSDFCAGADLAELERISTMGEKENLADARRLGDLLLSLRAHPRPVVAVVQGRALAGGCGLATACDLVLAHEGAWFGYPEVHLGFVPAMVMALLRRKVTEGRAFELAVGGHRIPAIEAERIGLANEVFPDAEFEEGVAGRLARLAALPPTAVALTKGLLYELDGLDVAEGVARGAHVNVEARTSEACREGVRRFLSRRSDEA
jgi:methylglutaconyl-CoA hydratase